MGTFFQTSEAAEKARKWVVVDAAGAPIGRVASEIATLIRGKHKPEFTQHVDGGDFVIVLNASQVRFTGKKLEKKKYYRHSGYIGGLKEISAGDLLRKDPEQVIRHAVQGMLPRGPLGRRLIAKLKVYPGAEHPHAAQMPSEYKLRFTGSR
jgi:large subunit ribosomal protein L13